MKNLGAFVVLATVSVAHAAVLNYHPLSEENIALINQKAKTWKAGKNFEVAEWERVMKIASGVLPDTEFKHGPLQQLNPHDESESVPDSFDAREAWPKCDSIKQIWDQSNCGGAWAMAAAEAMSDRMCIHSNQTSQTYISAQDLLSCFTGCMGFNCMAGCNGGTIAEPWAYWRETGIVTGGLYQSGQGCRDYTLPPCVHFGDSTSRVKCSTLDVGTPECIKKCDDSSLDYEESRTFGVSQNAFTTEKNIQIEIYKNGPVSAGFSVYNDFPNYKSGVYVATTSQKLGNHAVKIIGWGTEDNTPYWLVANSWNSDWGDNGYFKVLRGKDHCDIEHAAAASPK